MSKSKTLNEEERETSGWTLAVIICSVLVIWAASGWLVSSTKDPGQFGDMFGAVNALFSGLAFATLIYTVFLQRRELQLQREELAATRIELQRTASAQEASEAALRAQAEASAQSANLAAVNAEAKTAISRAFADRVGPEIMRMKASGESLNKIAARLNVMGVQTSRNGMWTAKAVSRVLAA